MLAKESEERILPSLYIVSSKYFTLGSYKGTVFSSLSVFVIHRPPFAEHLGISRESIVIMTCPPLRNHIVIARTREKLVKLSSRISVR